MAFRFEALDVPEVVLVEPDRFDDERGFFEETYKRSAFVAAGIDADFVQDGHSFCRRGVLRGLHYQNPPRAQGKLVRAIRGAVFDVAVDIRVGSPTFGTWVGVVLSGENRRQLWVPPGFAHGFVVLGDRADVVYKMTHEYAPESEAGIVWNDGQLAVDWPVREPTLSRKDASLPPLERADNAFVYGASG